MPIQWGLEKWLHWFDIFRRSLENEGYQCNAGNYRRFLGIYATFDVGKSFNVYWHSLVMRGIGFDIYKHDIND